MEVNIEALKQLQISQEWVNYKQLCNKIDVKYAAGDEKIKQLEDLKSFCHYEKNGTKFKINEVITNQSNIFIPHKNNKYGQEIYDIIFYLLRDIKQIYISKHKLLLNIGMINKEFSKLKYMDKDIEEYEEYIKIFNIDSVQLDKALQVIYNILTSKIDNYLKDLCNIGYFDIEYSFQYQMNTKKSQIDNQITNIELNSDLYKKINKYAEEIDFFKKNMTPSLRNEKYKQLLLWLKRELKDYNIKNIWRCYVLTVNNNLPQIPEEKFREYIKKINKTTIEILNQSTQIKLKKQQKKTIIDKIIKTKTNNISLSKSINSQYLCPVMNCYCDKLENYRSCK